MARFPSPPGSRGAKNKGPLLRERRTLVATREERLRDLGGVVLELHRRGESREELVQALCEELLHVDARLHEIDAELSGSSVPGEAQVVRCVCGAPLAWDAELCEVCGWPAAGLPQAAAAEE